MADTTAAKTSETTPDYLVVSCSLNSGSNSRLLARYTLECLKEQGLRAGWLDLRETPLPQCDGDEAYNHPSVADVRARVESAACILLALPVYNFNASSAAKNLVELTGDAWTDKVVGFMCAAGGKLSYMAIMGLANSLMLDFRSIVIPRFVYADSSAFQDGKLVSDKVKERLVVLAQEAVRFTTALKGS